MFGLLSDEKEKKLGTAFIIVSFVEYVAEADSALSVPIFSTFRTFKDNKRPLRLVLYVVNRNRFSHRQVRFNSQVKTAFDRSRTQQTIQY